MLALVESLVRRGQSLLVDAYCGAGLFAKRLAPLFETVIGIEENPGAIARAQQHASERERYMQGDVSGLLGDLLTAFEMQRTTVLLDPPAEGIAPRVVDLLLGRVRWRSFTSRATRQPSRGISLLSPAAIAWSR